MIAQQTVIVVGTSSTPAAADAKSSDLAPSSGGSRFVVTHYGQGRYLPTRVATSLGGGNAGPQPDTYSY